MFEIIRAGIIDYKSTHINGCIIGKKKCKIYIVLPRNNQHQSVYNCINLLVYYRKCVNLH